MRGSQPSSACRRAAYRPSHSTVSSDAPKCVSCEPTCTCRPSHSGTSRSASTASSGRQAELRAVMRGSDRLVRVGVDARASRAPGSGVQPASRARPISSIESRTTSAPAFAGVGAGARPPCCCRGRRSARPRSPPRARTRARRRSRRPRRVPPRPAARASQPTETPSSRRRGTRPARPLDTPAPARGRSPRRRRRAASRTARPAPSRAARRSSARRRRSPPSRAGGRAAWFRSLAACREHGYTGSREAAYYLTGKPTRPRRAASPTASPSRGFFVFGDKFDDGHDRPQRIRPAGHRAEMAGGLGGRARVCGRQPGAGGRGERPRLLHARDAPVPVGQRDAHGPRPELHAGRRRHPFPPPERLHGAAPDGLRRLRPAGRERGDQGGRPPARDHRSQHRVDRPPDAPPRLGDRLGSRGLGARADLLSLDAVALPEVLRARPGLPEGCAGQLVPATTRPCSRTST